MSRRWWIAWGVAWVILGVTLLNVLPVSPAFSIPYAGSIRFERFVAPDLALFWRHEKKVASTSRGFARRG